MDKTKVKKKKQICDCDVSQSRAHLSLYGIVAPFVFVAALVGRWVGCIATFRLGLTLAQLLAFLLSICTPIESAAAGTKLTAEFVRRLIISIHAEVKKFT